MKIILRLTICAVILFCSSAIYAAPVGNIATPALLESALISESKEDDKIGILGAFEADIINDRNLEGQDGKTDLRFYNGKIGLIFADRAIAYGLLGTGRIESKFKQLGNTIKFESNTDVAWGAGGTIILYEKTLYSWDNSIIRLGADGRYRSTSLEADRILVGATRYDIPDPLVSNIDIDYQDWQVAGAVSWQWKRLIPYVGGKYSDSSGNLRATVAGTTYDTDIEADSKFGIFFGTDILIKDPITEKDTITVNIEFRLIDEQAVTIGGAVRF
ncbi:hypothetical protein ACFL0T_02670 [Candidatus Omnitrophota bacterium]